MDDRYQGREQSAAKHLILESYLEKLVYKVGFNRPDLTLNYVDGFAGPWESQTDDLSDTSPFLALRKLIEVRDGLAKHHRQLAVRAFFVSTSRAGATQLRALESQFTAAAIQIEIGTFEDALGAAASFARGGSNPFAFIFIDPTGWTGFGLRAITPLLRTGGNEVLINFMTGDVVRFVDTPDPRFEGSFVDLFGDASYRDAWRGLQGLEREDRIVETYCGRVAQAGGYRHCVSSVVLSPRADRTRFHLVYGTRSDEGLVTFREVERAALAFQRTSRAEAQQRDRVRRTGQGELFEGARMVNRTLEDELRERYLERAFGMLDVALARAPDVVAWDTLVLNALRVPMVAEQDVKDWIKSRAHLAEVVGLASPRARTPKWNHGHMVRRIR